MTSRTSHEFYTKIYHSNYKRPPPGNKQLTTLASNKTTTVHHFSKIIEKKDQSIYSKGL